jgi:hypothetical protein
MILADKEATEPNVPIGSVEAITKFYSHDQHHDLVSLCHK